MPTPMSVLPTNTTTNAHAEARTPPGWYVARYITTATASFRTLSPNTTANRSRSTRRSPNTARTVTGSVAETMAPKVIAFKKVNACETPSCPSPHITSPNAPAPTIVPPNAKTLIVPRLRKKGSASSAYPDSKITGGRRNRKKNSVSKTR